MEKTVRLRPIPRAEWSREMGEALAALRVGAPEFPPTASPRPRADNIVGLFAHHPALARAYFTLNAHLLWSSSFTPRERELLILRVAAVRQTPYEFAQHVHLARDAGLTDAEIERVVEGADAEGWSAHESALLSAVDELIAGNRISDATWAVLVERYDTRQMMDLIFTIGGYVVLAMACDSFDLELDDDLAGTTPHL